MRSKRIWCAVGGGLALALAAAGCGKTAAKAAADPPPAASAQLFTVPPDQMSHVQVVAAATVTWPRLLRLTGNVDFDQFATTPVITPVSGPVTRILAATGQQVAAGETLLEVSSPDVAAARSTYLKASDAVKLAQQVDKRDEDLLEHHAIAQADLEQAQSALEQAQADLETARAALKILGVAEPAPGSAATALIAVKAPIAGQVVERDVAPGQLLQGGATQCFVISDTRKMWVLANVYQSDLDYVHVGDPVTIETDAYPEPFHGRIQYLSPALDPATRTLQARIETANPRGELKKQMYVTAEVEAGSLGKVIVVPDAAVLRDEQNVPFVYVESGAPNQFAHRTVAIGASRGGATQITSGLAAGERVVGDGSLFLQFANSFQH